MSESPSTSVGPLDLGEARVVLGAGLVEALPAEISRGDALWAEPSAFVLRRHLGFDTDVFGLPMARLVIGAEGAAPGLAGLLEACVSAGDREYRHFTATVPAERDALLWALEDAGFRTVDVGVTFGWQPRVGPSPNPSAVTPRPAVESDLAALRRLSALLFRRSRFYRDPALEVSCADELHRRWIENCLRGRADVIWVSGPVGNPEGFVTCRVVDRVGTIELVGVDPTHHGKGVGQSLLAQAMRWFASKADQVRVKTQVTNLAAAALYQKAGFRLVEADVSLSQAV